MEAKRKVPLGLDSDDDAARESNLVTFLDSF